MTTYWLVVVWLTTGEFAMAPIPVPVTESQCKTIARETLKDIPNVKAFGCVKAQGVDV